MQSTTFSEKDTQGRVLHFRIFLLGHTGHSCCLLMYVFIKCWIISEQLENNIVDHKAVNMHKNKNHTQIKECSVCRLYPSKSVSYVCLLSGVSVSLAFWVISKQTTTCYFPMYKFTFHSHPILYFTRTALGPQTRFSISWENYEVDTRNPTAGRGFEYDLAPTPAEQFSVKAPS
jgi:hypothetical protein